jgi:hypothetical protein
MRETCLGMRLLLCAHFRPAPACQAIPNYADHAANPFLRKLFGSAPLETRRRKLKRRISCLRPFVRKVSVLRTPSRVQEEEPCGAGPAETFVRKASVTACAFRVQEEEARLVRNALRPLCVKPQFLLAPSGFRRRSPGGAYCFHFGACVLSCWCAALRPGGGTQACASLLVASASPPRVWFCGRIKGPTSTAFCALLSSRFSSRRLRENRSLDLNRRASSWNSVP